MSSLYWIGAQSAGMSVSQLWRSTKHNPNREYTTSVFVLFLPRNNTDMWFSTMNLNTLLCLFYVSHHTLVTQATKVTSDHSYRGYNPDSKAHGANMGPTWVLSAPDGSHVGHMNLAMCLSGEPGQWHGSWWPREPFNFYKTYLIHTLQNMNFSTIDIFSNLIEELVRFWNGPRWVFRTLIWSRGLIEAKSGIYVSVI